MRKVYLTICQDKGYEPDVLVFANREDAEKNAADMVDEYDYVYTAVETVLGSDRWEDDLK